MTFKRFDSLPDCQSSGVGSNLIRGFWFGGPAVLSIRWDGLNSACRTVCLCHTHNCALPEKWATLCRYKSRYFTYVLTWSGYVRRSEMPSNGMRQLEPRSWYSTNTWGRHSPPQRHLDFCVFAHASACDAVYPGTQRMKDIVWEKSTSRRPFWHVWRTVRLCS